MKLKYRNLLLGSQMSNIAIILLLTFISGCGASTEMTSVRDPQLAEKKYSAVLIIVNDEDLTAVKDVEFWYQLELKKKKIKVFRGTSIVPPTREYTADELTDIFQKNGIDAVLTVGFRGAGSSSSFVKLKSTPEESTTKGSARVRGDNLYYEETTTTERAKDIGFTVTKSWEKFIVKLYDAASGKVAWMATSVAHGNWVSDDQLVRSQAEKTAEKLIEENVIVK